MGQPPPSYRWVIAGLLLALNFTIGLSYLAVAPVLPLIIEEYGISRGSAGFLTGIVLLMPAVLGLPGGLLVGKLGALRAFTLGLLLAAAPVLSVLAGHFGVLLLLRALYGVGLVLLFPATAALILQWFPSRALPLVNGMTAVSVGLGITVSTFLAAPLADLIGWRWALSLLGSFAVASLVAWLVLGRSREEERVTQGISLTELRSVLRDRTTWLLALADVGPFAQYVALSTWLPTYFFEVRRMSLQQAGFTVGILHFMGVVAPLVAGLLPLLIARRKPFLFIPGAVLGCAGFASFLVHGTPALYLVMAVLGFCSWFYGPILFTIPLELPGTSPRRVALVFAFMLTIGSTVSMLAPATVGITTDLFDTYVPAFSLWALLSFSLLLCGLLLPETGRRRGEERPPILSSDAP